MKKPGPLIIPPQSLDLDDQAIGVLFERVRSLVQTARRSAATTVNSLQVITNFEIGRMIIEHEQQGIHRAEYGKMVLKALSERLIAEFGRGFSEDNLSNMRKFYLVYKDRLTGISEKPSRKSVGGEKSLRVVPIPQMPSGKLVSKKSQMASGQLQDALPEPSVRIPQMPSAQLGAAFPMKKRLMEWAEAALQNKSGER
ncbi:MAG: hypothetical protein A2W25_06035 [candidate division Zixibacteria bacterium RBG_16_53_22]|nr:MAG: hypothetical protein A2W25_06035 [candidate division Zixibacteria bacterium RBG_16_53_22]